MSGFHPLLAFCAALLVVSVLLIFGVLDSGDRWIGCGIGGAVMFVVWSILESAHDQ